MRACSELGRFSMKTELFREINCRFVLNELGDPTIRLYMIYPNFKNFSLFNFQIFRLIHYCILILGVSLEACKRSIRLLLLSFYGNVKAFCCNKLSEPLLPTLNYAPRLYISLNILASPRFTPISQSVVRLY